MKKIKEKKSKQTNKKIKRGMWHMQKNFPRRPGKVTRENYSCMDKNRGRPRRIHNTNL